VLFPKQLVKCFITALVDISTGSNDSFNLVRVKAAYLIGGKCEGLLVFSIVRTAFRPPA
jgi:hypothetical protein